jgi:hypothetical protein
MIVRGTSLCATLLGGEVHVEAAVPLSLEGLFLGGAGRPGWEELKQVGPIRFGIAPADASKIPGESDPSFQRDFGDSCVRCSSNAGAVTRILPEHRQGDPLHIPTAMAFAFAQQWARHGHACVHGALLRVADTGVLVVGQRAAGKSVLSASALAAGGAIVSDDFLLTGFASGKLVGERIRRFLSLRRSWAARSLRETFTDAWTNNRNGSRAFLRIPDGDARFPESSSIDRVWVLGRPKAGRRETSTLAPVEQAELYAAIVAAIQPLLLGADFPYERERLGAVVTHLVASTPAARIETGQDIVLEPAVTWQRLLSESV